MQRDQMHLDFGWNYHWWNDIDKCERRGSGQQEENGKVEDDNPTLTPTVNSDFQSLSELLKVLFSLELAYEILSYANKIDNLLAAIHI